MGGRVRGMVVDQWTNQWDTVDGPKRRAVQVGKKPVAQLRIAPEDAEGRLPVGPGLSRSGMSMGPGMREEQSHLRPAHVQFRAGRVRQCRYRKKAADVKAGKGRARQDPAERAAQTGRHVGKGACGIAAPVHGISLRAGVSRASPDEPVIVYLFGRLKDSPLVKQRIQVVQLLSRRAVVSNGVVRQV